MSLTDDLELLEAFSGEVKELKGDLIKIVDKLKVDQNIPTLFAEFGQTIDRVYGTAATLGYQEIADYCRTMKEVTYKCSQSNDELGRRLTLRLMVGCLNNLDFIILSVANPEEFENIKSQMKKELEKSMKLQSSLFGEITRGSVT